MAKRYSKRPNIPGLSALSPEVRNILEPVKQLLEIHEGRRGNPQTDRFVRAGEVDWFARLTTRTARPASTDAPDPPTDVEVVAGSWGNRVSWTNATDDDLWAVEVFASTSNDWTDSQVIATVTISPDQRGEKSQYVHPIDDDILPDHYYWVRSVDYSGNVSRLAPPDETNGLLAPGHDTVGQTIDKILDSLEAPNAPDWDEEKDDYTTGQIVTRSDKLWQCYNDPVPAGAEPGTTEGADYWRRTGILTQGDVDGQPTVGVNGNLTVDGTILGRSLAADMVISNVIRSHNYSEGVGGFKLDADNGKAEFNSMTLQIVGGSGAKKLEDGPAESGATNDSGWRSSADASLIDGGKIWAGSEIQIGNLDGESDYCVINNGDIEFFWYLNGEHRLHKSLKQIDSGTVTAGETKTLNGYWKSTPVVMVSPAVLDVYNADYPDQSQKLDCRAQNIQETDTEGVYEFEAIAELQLSAGEGVIVVDDEIYQTSGGMDDGESYYTDTHTTADNVTEITVNGKWDLLANNYTAVYDDSGFDHCEADSVTIDFRIYVYIDGNSYKVVDYLDYGDGGSGASRDGTFSKTVEVSAGTHDIKVRLIIDEIDHLLSSECSGGSPYISVEFSNYTTNIKEATAVAEGSLNYIAIGTS